MLRPSVTISLAWAVLSVVGCSGSDAATEPAAPNNPQNPNNPNTPNVPVVSFDNRVLLFVIPSATSTSQFVPEFGITLETNFQYLFRFVPSLNKLDQLQRNSSPSFAPSSKTWYSSDDRIFIPQEFRAGEASGRTDIVEYSFDQFQQIRQVLGLPNMSHSSGCAAAVGDTYYFRRNRTFEVLTGDVGGEFYKAAITTTSTPQLLLAFSNPANCFGNLLSVGGVLYDVFTNPKDRPSTIALYRRNLSTGLPEATPALSFNETATASYSANSYRFAVDEGVFYVARQRQADGFVEIWRQALNSVSGTQPTKILDRNTGFQPRWFEVDDGRVMLAGTNGQVLLWDMTTNQFQPVSFGGSITAITQIYARR